MSCQVVPRLPPRLRDHALGMDALPQAGATVGVRKRRCVSCLWCGDVCTPWLLEA